MWSRTASEKLISHLSYRIYEDPVLVQSSILSPTLSLRVRCVTCMSNKAKVNRLGSGYRHVVSRQSSGREKYELKSSSKPGDRVPRRESVASKPRSTSDHDKSLRKDMIRFSLENITIV
jgi:hypothetical protein